MMEQYIIGRVLHVLGVVLWIGGVAMVTTVLLPVSRSMKRPGERVAFFERIESRFAWQARFTTLLTGITGFWMLSLIDGWSRYQSLSFWWLHAMTAVWIIFTLVLFVLEPLVLHRLFLRKAEQEPEKTFAVIQVMHWALLMISLVTVAGAVAGSHGWFLD
jgi:uncharacterized membrane protein